MNPQRDRPHSSKSHRARVLSRLCGVVVALLGLAVVLAWLEGAPERLQLRPGWAPVQFNLGLGLALLGLVCALPGSRLRLAMAVSATALGLLTLLQYVFFVDLGIDTLIHDAPLLPATSNPGRMAPLAATALTLGGGSLVLALVMKRPALRREALWSAASFGLLAGGLQLIAYVVGVPGLGGGEWFTHMGLLAALAMALLGLGLAIRMRPPLRRGVERARALVISGCQVLLLGGLVLWLMAVSRDLELVATESDLAVARLNEALSVNHVERVGAMYRLAATIAEAGLPETPAQWRELTGPYLREFRYLEGVGVVDADGRIEHVWDARGRMLEYPGRHFATDAERSRFQAAARSGGGPAVSGLVELIGGRPGFLTGLAMPGGGAGAPPPVLVVAVDLEGFMAWLAGRMAPEYAFRARGSAERWLGGPAPGVLERRFLRRVEPESVPASPGWYLELWPRKPAVVAATSPASRLLLPIFFVVAVLVWLALRARLEIGNHLATIGLVRERLETASELGQVGYWAVDAASGRLVLSRQIYRMAGLHPSRFRHRYDAYLDMVPESDRARIQAARVEVAAGADRVDLGHRLRRPDGDTVRLRLRARAVRAGDGSLLRLEGSLQDVTAVEEARRALERHSRQVEQLADLADRLLQAGSLADAARAGADFTVDILDADQVEVTIDDAGNGEPVRAMAPDRAGPEADPPSSGAWVNMPLTRRDGSRAGRLAVRAGDPAGFGDDDQQLLGQAAGLLSAAVTSFELVAEVRQLNRELEARVRDRTRELAAANQELQAFAYSVSHDLRAPLRAISGFSRILDNHCGDQLDAQGRHYLERVRSSAQKLDQLITDLLELSRVARMEIRRQPVDLAAIARRFADQVSGQDSPDAPAIEWHIPDALVVRADPTLSGVVIHNLLDNAVKFSRGRSPAVIELNSEILDETTRICIRDNGAGFDARYADKLFGVFQRLHSDSEFPGTGVGLATVARIIRRHGGTIAGHSGAQGGARFCFDFGPDSMAGADATDGGGQPAVGSSPG